MSHMNESCLIRMSHVSYEWVMSHMNESCLIWMSRVSQRNISIRTSSRTCHTWMSHVSQDWVMSHINESCPTKKHQHANVISHMSHVHESWHIWMSHVTHTKTHPQYCAANETWPYEWVIFYMNATSSICHTWLSQKKKRSIARQKRYEHTNESCPIWMRHVLYVPHAKSPKKMHLRHCQAKETSTFGWVKPYMSHGTHTTYMSHVTTYMSHVKHTSVWSHICHAWVMSRMKESCHTYKNTPAALPGKRDIIVPITPEPNSSISSNPPADI